MSKPTEDDMQTLPHVTITSDVPWDPTTLDEDWLVDGLEEDAPDDESTSTLPFSSTQDDDSVSSAHSITNHNTASENYGEEFTLHDLNVYQCILDAKSNPDPVVSTSDTTDLPEAAPDPIIHIQEHQQQPPV